MFVIRDAKVLFMIHLGLAVVFALLFFRNSPRVKMAEALSQPLDRIEVVQGEIEDLRKVEYMALILPITKQYVDYSYVVNGQTFDKSFYCRGMSACYWLKTGPADIMIAQNGRYALPLALRENFQVYRKRTTRNQKTSFIMAVILSLMATVSGLSAGLIRLPVR